MPLKELAASTSEVEMPGPNASCALRLNREHVVISHQLWFGSSNPDAILKAERGQPVAAHRFLGREFNPILPSERVKLCFQLHVQRATAPFTLGAPYDKKK